MWTTWSILRETCQLTKFHGIYMAECRIAKMQCLFFTSILSGVPDILMLLLPTPKLEHIWSAVSVCLSICEQHYARSPQSISWKLAELWIAARRRTDKMLGGGVIRLKMAEFAVILVSVTVYWITGNHTARAANGAQWRRDVVCRPGQTSVFCCPLPFAPFLFPPLPFSVHFYPPILYLFPLKVDP